MERSTEKIDQVSKQRNWGYWVITILLCLGLSSGGVGQLLHAPWNVQGVIKLGYPQYVLYILGSWKILASIALLVPGFPLIKEWAYAGVFFLLSGALISHLASGDPFGNVVGILFLIAFTIASWYLRPPSRSIETKTRY